MNQLMNAYSNNLHVSLSCLGISDLDIDFKVKRELYPCEPMQLLITDFFNISLCGILKLFRN